MSKVTENENNVNLYDTPEKVIEKLKAALEERFNKLRAQATQTTNIWERYEIDIVLKELKYIYENILKEDI